jgi:chemotaxis protein histidine kinase CheA
MKYHHTRPWRPAWAYLFFGFIFSCSCCAAQDDRATELQAQIAELKSQIADEAAKSEAAGQAQANIDLAAKAIALAQEELPELEKEIEKMEYLIEAYRSAYRVTSSVTPGEKLGSATLVSGGVLTDAVYNGTTRGGIIVQTAAGVVTIPSYDVPVAWAGRFQLPPVIVVPPQTIAQLRAGKPDAAMGAAEKSAAQEAAKLALKKEKEAAVVAAAQAKEAAKADENKAYNELVQRNQARFAQIERLREEYKAVDAKLGQIRQQRSREQTEMQSSNVKQAASQLEKALGRYDVQISALETERIRLRDEVEKIRRSME